MGKQFGFQVCVYAKNQAGISNIYQLVSIAHTDQFFQTPTLNWETINQFRSNLIITNSVENDGLWDAIIQDDQADFLDQAQRLDYISLPNVNQFLHEIERGHLTQAQCEQLLKTYYHWAQLSHKKIVATNLVKYLNSFNETQYKALMHAKKIGGGAHHLYSYQGSNAIIPNMAYLNTESMYQQYQFLGLSSQNLDDLIVHNNQYFVDQISDQIQIIHSQLFTPTLDNGVQNFINKAQEMLHNKYGPNPDQFILDRFQLELDAIIKYNFSIIYWASYLLVQKSNADGYFVGSRGSVGSSIIAYLLKISEINPLPPHFYCEQCFYTEFHWQFNNSGFDLGYKPCPQCQHTMSGDGQNIEFAAFMGFNADKTPDIDLNFSGEYQARAHNFLKSLFGPKNCYRAGTVSTIAAKTAWMFAKRYYEIQKINPTFGDIQWIVSQVVDVKRTSGQHPGGILVIPQDKNVYDFTPINYPANDTSSDWLTTHFEYNYLHDSLLKFDVLGHDDPTILKMLYDLTGVDPLTIPNHDPNILSLFQTCTKMHIAPHQIMGEKTGAIGLPEFGTNFVRKLLLEAKPKSFGDLIRVSGLSHGKGVWVDNAERLIKNHKLTLDQVICCRDDIMDYLIKQHIPKLDAFNIMESVRKGKGISSEHMLMLVAQNVPDWYIKSANKITYMFPKAHAAAYVLMAWRVGYYKFYHPVAYYATYFSIRSDKFDINTLISNDPVAIEAHYRQLLKKGQQETKAKDEALKVIFPVALEMLARGIKFASVNINDSQATRFIPYTNNTILIPFNSIDGLGEVVANNIVHERSIKPFQSSMDLMKRCKISTTVHKKLKDLGVLVGLQDREKPMTLFD